MPGDACDGTDLEVDGARLLVSGQDHIAVVIDLGSVLPPPADLARIVDINATWRLRDGVVPRGP